MFSISIACHILTIVDIKEVVWKVLPSWKLRKNAACLNHHFCVARLSATNSNSHL